MAKARTLTLKTQVDVKGANELNKLGNQFQQTGSRIKTAMDPKNLFAAGVAAFGGAQVISLLSDATNAAAEYADSVGAAGVIFGEELIPQMEEWGDAAARNFGASKQEAISAANVIATLGKSAGLMGEELVGFSQEMVQLGGDLASMFGGSTQDAITAVGAALRGESEPIRRYGVLLDDATLRAKAFELGIISTTKNALTPQQRVLAAQASILEQTGDAQGDFLRTSDGMANTQREIAAELANVNIELGERLMPLMLTLARWAKTTGIPILRELFGLFEIGDPSSAQGIPILQEIEDFLNNTSDTVEDSALVFRDMLTGRENDIRVAADRMGVTYMDMRANVEEVMQLWGADHEQAIDYIIGQNDRLLSPENPLTNLGQFVAENMGGTQVRAAADEMAGGIVGAMEEAEETAKEVARRTPGSLANELRAGLDDYDKALEELTEIAVNSVSDLSERQKIEGILASQELTDALNSDSTRTRLLAQELVNDLVSDYELLAPGALGAGQLVNPELQRGMLSNLGLAEAAGQAIVDAAGNPLVHLPSEFYTSGAEAIRQLVLGIDDNVWRAQSAMYGVGQAMRNAMPFSEPKDPNSPLRGLGKAGEAIVEMMAGGIHRALGVGQGAANALAAALVPIIPSSGGVVGSGQIATGGGGGVTINLTVNGDLTSDREAGIVASILRSWDVAGMPA